MSRIGFPHRKVIMAKSSDPVDLVFPTSNIPVDYIFIREFTHRAIDNELENYVNYSVELCLYGDDDAYDLAVERECMFVDIVLDERLEWLQKFIEM